MYFRYFCCILLILISSRLNVVIGARAKYVTYNSLVKLLNAQFNVRLHSHDIKYGTGSGQQSITAIDTKEDGNSYWYLKGETGKNFSRGKPIECGDVIRLEHLSTKKNLHSHLVSSPLSGKQEVSAYGNNGLGDTGDHWMVVCDSDFWERDDTVTFKHIDTGTFLAVTGRSYGSPINGQQEVAGEYVMSTNTEWQAMEGLFVHPSDLKSHHHPHTEL